MIIFLYIFIYNLIFKLHYTNFENELVIILKMNYYFEGLQKHYRSPFIGIGESNWNEVKNTFLVAAWQKS